MSDAPSLAAESERRLNEALAQCLEAVEAGQMPDRAALRAQHPDLVVELDEFFANLAEFTPSALIVTKFGGKTLDVRPAADDAALPPGSRLGDYEILKEIARGGMGIVYRARQLSLNREVALKMILSGRQDQAQSLRRFRVEAEAAARLDHPNIVPIYEVGDFQGRPYFTMKLVEGGGLHERLCEFQLLRPEDGLPPSRSALDQRGARLAGLLAAIARAVHHAHQRGILHRDLKPANILLDVDGRPQVADFGLAKRVEAPSDLTQSLAVVGTASYMAPEQALGNKRLLTTTADIYSLGAILYELLTGRPPIVGNSYFDTLVKVVDETPLPPAQRNRFVPNDLQMICLTALAKEPEQRYETALGFAQDLERWSAGDIISLRSPNRAERVLHWVRRNRLAAAMLGAIAALIAVTTIGSVLAAWKISLARDRADANATAAAAAKNEAEQQATRALVARNDAETALKEKQRVLASSYVANGTHALDGGDIFGALLWYGEALRLDQGDAAREAPHRIRLAGVLRRCPKLLQVWFDQDPALAPAFSPDGRRVALLQNDNARIWDIASSNATSPPLRHAGNIERAEFSADGARLVTTAADGTACVWSAASGKALTPMLRHETALNWAGLSPDGASLVTAGADHFARVWDLRTGKLRFELRHEMAVLFAAFTADGKQLTTCGGDSERTGGELSIWDLQKSPPTSRVFRRPGVLHWAEQTLGGQSVVAIGARHTAHLWSLAASKLDGPSVTGVSAQDLDGVVGVDPTRVLRLEDQTAQVFDLGHEKAVGAPLLHGGAVVLGRFSRDGAHVVTAARDRTARVWNAGAGNPLTPPLPHGALVRHAALSDDGQQLLTVAQNGVVRVWELPTRDDGKPIELGDGRGPTALSPDGRLFASVDTRGAVQICDTTDNKLRHGPWQVAGLVVAVRFSPDGRHVAAASEAEARVFNCGPGDEHSTILAHRGPVRELAFTPDASRVAILGDKDGIEVYDATSGALQASGALPGNRPPGGLLLAPDGRHVAALLKGRHSIVWRDFAGRLTLGPFRHDGVISAAAISPDGSRIAVGTADGCFLWDAAARPAAPPLQLGAPLWQVIFSGDGRLLATLAEDETARVWDVQTGQPITPLLKYDKPVVAISLAADGSRLAVLCSDGHSSVDIVDLAPDPRPADDLVRLTQLLGGHKVHSMSGGLEPIETALLRAAWPHLRAIYPQEFTAKKE